MRATVLRALAALMALILLLGQMQPITAAMMDESDSSQEPPASSAQIQEEPASSQDEADEPEEEKAEEKEEKPEETEQKEAEPEQEKEADAEQEKAKKESGHPEREQDESEEDAKEAESSEPKDSQEKASEADIDADKDAEKKDASAQKKEEREAASSSDNTEEQTVVAQFAEEELQEQYTITVSGELPEEAEIVAEDAAEEAMEAGVKHILCAYDITIDDGWQPEEAVEVTIQNEEITKNVHVFHIGDRGEPEEVEITRSEDGKVVFDAEGFSIYVVTDDLFRRTYEFWDYNNGSWVRYEFNMTLPEDHEDEHYGFLSSNRQILRNGDTLVVPSLPNKSDSNMRFLGWYTSPTGDLNVLKPERGGVKKDITSDSIVTLYARYGKFFTITYYARPKGTDGNQVFSTQTVLFSEGASSVNLDLSEQLYPDAPSSGLGFVGWLEEESGQLIDMTDYEISSNVTLYPVFDQMRKVSFDTAYVSAGYIHPEWIKPDGFTGQITDHIPEREGYTFTGWQVGGVILTDENSNLLPATLSFDGGSLTNGVLHLDSDITLTSTWTADEVVYRVCIWQEKTSDVKKLEYNSSSQTWEVPEDKRTYDFVGTFDVNALAGSTVERADLEPMTRYGGQESVPMNDGLSLDFTGMRFCALKNSVASEGFQPFTVSGDSSSMVHVYYDREVVSVAFDFPEDVTESITIANPEYSPELPASGTVTQKAVTAIQQADYPDDLTFIGLYGSPFADGKSETGESAYWPVSYTISNPIYTVSTRTMQYSSGKWNQKSISSSTVNAESLSMPTRWLDEDGAMVDYEETFCLSETHTPAHTLEHLRAWDKDGTVSYYRENEQAPYPSSAVYASTAAYSFNALSNEEVVVDVPFSGYELDYFTYIDSKGTPIRRESTDSQAIPLEQRTLTGGSFTNLKIYCKRNVHTVYLHNGNTMLSEFPKVKYNMSLATDYVKQYLVTPSVPAEYAGEEGELEFIGWFMDPELSVYVDFAGLKVTDRARLQQQYSNIREITSVYDYRNEAGQTVGAMRMTDSDLHLFAGWVKRRVLVQLEPDGGELPENVPTYFWEEAGKTLSVFPITRDYVPWTSGEDAYVYHIHTYAQSLMDNDTADQTACYRAASGSETGTLYAHQPDSYRFLGWFQVDTLANGNEVLTPYNHGSPSPGTSRCGRSGAARASTG